MLSSTYVYRLDCFLFYFTISLQIGLIYNTLSGRYPISYIERERERKEGDTREKPKGDVF